MDANAYTRQRLVRFGDTDSSVLEASGHDIVNDVGSGRLTFVTNCEFALTNTFFSTRKVEYHIRTTVHAGMTVADCRHPKSTSSSA